MRDTGIVRRIDELGRVVIPKEIRKTLRIKQGDPLEIYTDKDELLFRKYSPIASLYGYAEDVIESLASVSERPCLICDTDKVIFASRLGKDVVDRNLTSEVQDFFKSRKNLLSKKVEGNKILPIYKGENHEYHQQIIVPIVSNGDCFGAIMMFCLQEECELTETDLKLCTLSATYLAKHFE